MIDAGISGRQADLRMTEHDLSIHETTALLISHDHRDHAQNMGVFHRKFGMPVYMTGKTYQAARRWCNLGRIEGIQWFQRGQTLTFGDVLVHSLPTPHDGADSVAFIIEHGDKRVGILSDLGHVFAGLKEVLESLDAVVIESNYDQHLLSSGDYPERLKARIRGPGGHLSNEESAGLVHAGEGRLQWACLCHLSEENNAPHLALRTHAEVLGSQFPLHVSTRHEATDLLRIE